MINLDDRIITGKDEFPANAYSHDFILRYFIFERLTKGYKEGGQYFPPDEKVCNWYGIKINEKDSRSNEDLKFEEAMNFFDKKQNEQ